MSSRFYLQIHRGNPAGRQRPPLGDRESVKKLLNTALPRLRWANDAEAQNARLSLWLSPGDGPVRWITIEPKAGSLKKFGNLCREKGWRVFDPDAESAEEVDLADIEGWYLRHHG